MDEQLRQAAQRLADKVQEMGWRIQLGTYALKRAREEALCALRHADLQMELATPAQVPVKLEVVSDE